MAREREDDFSHQMTRTQKNCQMHFSSQRAFIVLALGGHGLSPHNLAQEFSLRGGRGGSGPVGFLSQALAARGQQQPLAVGTSFPASWGCAALPGESWHRAGPCMLQA